MFVVFIRYFNNDAMIHDIFVVLSLWVKIDDIIDDK